METYLISIKDDFVRFILEKIFVLKPEERPTASELVELLRSSRGLTSESMAKNSELSIRYTQLRDVSNNTTALLNLFKEGSNDKSDSMGISDSFNFYAAAESKATLLLSMKNTSWTPLMCAAVVGDIETAKKHLSSKDKKNSDGNTAYMLAIRADQGEMLGILDPTDSNGVTALMRAADRGDIDEVKLLIPLQKGRQAPGETCVNGRMMSNRTALIGAAACGCLEIVKLLIEHEGGMQDDTGSTALIWAAFNNHPECVAVLREKESCMQKYDGLTALMVAAWNGHLVCVKLLLEKEVGMQDRYGRTAFMWAILNNHPDCVQLLANRERELKTKYAWNCFLSGSTALDIAKRRGYSEIISTLLQESSQ